MTIGPLLAMLAAAATPAGPPAPTVGPVETLRKVVVEAIRNCPKAAEGEIVVCSPDRGLAEGYRLPKIPERYDYEGSHESASAERRRRMRGGEAGIGSCSAVGAGGASGCALKSLEEGQ